jgi:hypothetical protein
LFGLFVCLFVCLFWFQFIFISSHPLDLADAIAHKSGPKILLLNGYHDRETHGMTAMCFVRAIARALNNSRARPVAMVSGERIGEDANESKSKSSAVCASSIDGLESPQECEEYACVRFVTHVLYVAGSTIPLAEEEVASAGIRLVSVAGAPRNNEKPLYDVMALIRTLAALFVEPVVG